MIKASELRPGNIVYRHMPQDKEVITVEEVRRSDAHLIRYFVKSFLCPAYENELSGIPLTDEWLVKLGFQQHEVGYFYIQVGNQLYLEYHDISNGVQVVPETWNDAQIYPWCQCLYVHQLQNLYHALTSEELQLKESWGK